MVNMAKTFLAALAMLSLLAASCRQREEPEPAFTTAAAPPRVIAEQLRMPLVAGEGQAALEDFRGKVLLVDFFGGSMEECRAEIPPLNALLAEMNGKPFALLGIAMDLKPQIYVADDMRDAQPAFPYVLGGKPARQAFPSVHVLPTKWLLDRSGNIVKRYEGATPLTQIRADMDELLK